MIKRGKKKKVDRPMLLFVFYLDFENGNKSYYVIIFHIQINAHSKKI